MSNQTEYTVLLGDNISLTCGFNLMSQREIKFIWFSPTGTLIKRSEPKGYSVEDGPDVVRLNVTNATMRDDGLWNCTAPASAIRQSTAIVLLQIQLTVVGEYSIL